MSTSTTLAKRSSNQLPANDGKLAASARECGAVSSRFRKWFDVEPSIVDGQTGDILVRSTEQPVTENSIQGELCREISRRGRPELIQDADLLVTLAVPFESAGEGTLVAVATFLTRPPASDDEVAAAAKESDIDPDAAMDWAVSQIPAPAALLMRLANLAVAHEESEQECERLRNEVQGLSSQLVAAYEEISLVRSLTHDLRLSDGEHEFGRRLLDGLSDLIEAEGLALLLNTPASEQVASSPQQDGVLLLTTGACGVNAAGFQQLVSQLGLGTCSEPCVVNAGTTTRSDWPEPSVRQLVVVALAERDRHFGWLAAINHCKDGEFGTVEANLLRSVAELAGVHCGNLDLYRQQEELFTGVVKAMSSAIDAKDPYTRGHSNRVARVAVRLAQELHCDESMLRTVYISGLLHDVGKIGIDDTVLRKPGRLTEAEYAHIKTHADIGYQILRGLRQMQDILPGVRHHHEAWNGKGYPHGLRATEIPLLARILAVADSYDAMASDRPYRDGMDHEQLDAIIRQGSGEQWDAEVVDAFFRARDDIARISGDETESEDLSMRQWA